MEQFYEITPHSGRFAECMTYWNETDKQNEKVREFMSNHNILSPALWRGDILYIKKRPDMSDDNFLKKTVEDNGTCFNSLIFIHIALSLSQCGEIKERRAVQVMFIMESRNTVVLAGN